MTLSRSEATHSAENFAAAEKDVPHREIELPAAEEFLKNFEAEIWPKLENRAGEDVQELKKNKDMLAKMITYAKEAIEQRSFYRDLALTDHLKIPFKGSTATILTTLTSVNLFYELVRDQSQKLLTEVQ